MPPGNTAIFTDQEIEKMRLFVMEHDKKASPNTFDLNNPPRKAYVHQEFPRIVYSRDAEGKVIGMKVHTQDEMDEAVADGYTLTPQAPLEHEEPELDTKSAAEAASFDKRLAEVKKSKAAKLAKK